MNQPNEIKAAFKALVETMQEVKWSPQGHLYMGLMSMVDLESFQFILQLAVDKFKMKRTKETIEWTEKSQKIWGELHARHSTKQGMKNELPKL